jgi:putative serine/threonine protein kinase
LVETNELVNEPYSTILGYPRYSSDELKSRVRELQTNGVDALLFEGSNRIGKLGMLGKGCVSVVVKAIHNDEVIALKIRRTDADRATMDREGEFLKLANSVDIGPRFIKSSKNFLLMDLADGINIFKFMEAENNKARVLNVVSEVLEQCYRLDRTGLDHGELSYMAKHVIVGDKVTIIDFESASVNRRVSNVTAATQYLFIGGVVAEKIRKLLKVRSIDAVISSLREYKNDASKENLERLKKVLNL